MNEQKSIIKNSGFSRFWIGNEPSNNDESMVVTLDDWQLLLTGLLLGALYSAVTLDFSISLQIYYLFCVTGLVVGLRNSIRLPLTESEKFGLMVVFIFCLISILTFWLNGMPGKGNIYVQGRHGKFLLAIAAYFFFRNYLIPIRLIWMLSTFIALQLLIVAIIDYSTTDVFDLPRGWPGRASGNTHPIYFAVESLMMAVIILAFRDDWRQKSTSKLIAKIGITAAIIALIMTGSRSVWLALPIIGVMYMVSRAENVKPKYVAKVIILVLISTALLYQIPTIKDRWGEAIEEFNSYLTSESAEDPVRDSSLGARLEMWRAARLMILSNPLLGVGTGGFQVTATKYYENGGWSHDITTRSGPHNQYLNSWASRGVIGLIAMILVLAVPFVYCLRIRKKSKSGEARQLALACMMIVLVFAVAGLSEDVLEKKPLIILYLTSLTLMLGQIRHRTALSS